MDEKYTYKLAMYFEKSDNNRVHCLLCPQNCTIKPNEVGICNARKNIDGNLYTLNYGKISSIALDPIEKKPLYHFYPKSFILSVGTFGCNLKCGFCQNWTIAQDEPKLYDISSYELVEKAIELKSKKNIGIAYTYNEPSIWYEFVYETSKLASKNNLKNVLVTNGFINKECLTLLLPFIDAMNIDVKAFTEQFYKNICKGSLENVIETVEFAYDKCHVELTTLIVPGYNDNEDEIVNLCKWISGLSRKIPLHLSRFFPNYKMLDKKPTDKNVLYKLKEKALKYLDYVYIGNL